MEEEVAVNGKSGSSYKFGVYSRNNRWNPVAGVYLVLKKGNAGRYAPVYVGETDNLGDRFQCHHKQPCFDHHGWTHLGFLKEIDVRRRLVIERDILKNFPWVCNG